MPRRRRSLRTSLPQLAAVLLSASLGILFLVRYAGSKVYGRAVGSQSVAADEAAIRSGARTLAAPESLSRPTPIGPGETELPRVFLTTSMSATPSNGRKLSVRAGGNLQAALDSARLGDRILLEPCGVYRGNFTYGPPKAGNRGEWVTVQSSGETPPEGTRTSPAMAKSMCYPKLISATTSNTLVSRPSAHHWRFIGLEITVDPKLTTNPGTILAGDASEAQNTLASVPTNLIFDRLYVHGQPNVDMRKCIALNSASTAVIDSYLSECHSAFDAQAITGTNGPGPFKIVNNHLEGAAENIAWGGADPHIQGLVPADIEIRGNHLFKPLSLKGSQWLEKNIIESKNSTRVLVEGNVLENSWNHAQVGYSFALWSVNQDGSCTWCVTSHWTIRNNVMKNVSAGVNLTAVWERSRTVPAHHFAISHNVWTNYVEFAVLQFDSIPYLTFEHNTGVGGVGFSFGAKSAQPGLVIRNNIVGGYYGISASWGSNAAGWAGVGGGTGSQWRNNVLPTEFGWTDPAIGQYSPKAMSDVGFVTMGSEGSIDRLALAPTSAFKGKGTDRKDVGADIAAVKAATAGVVADTAEKRTPR
jgi:hypothetical protein